MRVPPPAAPGLTVPVEKTLATVERELAEGRTAAARQRLRGLVGSLPLRLDLRERLADAYRREGDLAQAGRWSYLAQDRSPAEVAAFERAYGQDPVQMMRALAWPGLVQDAPTDAARERLQALASRAQARHGVPVDYRDPRAPEPPTPWWETAGLVGCGLLALAVVVLVLVGAGALAAHGLEVLLRLLA